MSPFVIIQWAVATIAAAVAVLAVLAVGYLIRGMLRIGK